MRVFWDCTSWPTREVCITFASASKTTILTPWQQASLPTTALFGTPCTPSAYAAYVGQDLIDERRVRRRLEADVAGGVGVEHRVVDELATQMRIGGIMITRLRTLLYPFVSVTYRACCGN